MYLYTYAPITFHYFSIYTRVHYISRTINYYYEFLRPPAQAWTCPYIQRQTKATHQTRLHEWSEITNADDGIIVIESGLAVLYIYQVCIIYYYNCIYRGENIMRVPLTPRRLRHRRRFSPECQTQ